jgi:FKBP-type peptidyl-prolyl cis-trans isomerase
MRTSRHVLLAGALVAIASTTPAWAQAVAPVPGDLQAYEQLGWASARNAGIAELNWTEAQFAAFVAGVRAAHEKRPVTLDDAGRRLLTEMQRRIAEVRAREKLEQDPKLRDFLRNMRASAGMQQTESGLLYRVIMPGSGPRPRAGDLVVASLNVKMPDGRTEIPALSGQDIPIQVGDLPPGVNEALQLLALGGHGVFVVPPYLSFGTGTWPEGVPPGTPILLQIELKEIRPATPAG